MHIINLKRHAAVLLHCFSRSDAWVWLPLHTYLEFLFLPDGIILPRPTEWWNFKRNLAELLSWLNDRTVVFRCLVKLVSTKKEASMRFYNQCFRKRSSHCLGTLFYNFLQWKYCSYIHAFTASFVCSASKWGTLTNLKANISDALCTLKSKDVMFLRVQQSLDFNF